MTSMAVSLGKRKRAPFKREQAHDSGEDEQQLRSRFQRAFEAKFRPLEHAPIQPHKIDTTDSDSDSTDEISKESDWSGFSDDEEDDPVEVVAHVAANGNLPEVHRSHQRAYMSSKPPSSAAESMHSQSKQKSAEKDDASEAANFKHDLALQRLLKESHLLEPGSFNTNSTVPEGKGRLRALDLRLQDLGAKTSLATQEKMPIAHRKGISSKAVGREQKRRKDAADNGVILEKVKHATKDTKWRDRSVGGPTVGKFRGGTLKLSGKDLRDIQGPKKQVKGNKGGR